MNAALETSAIDSQYASMDSWAIFMGQLGRCIWPMSLSQYTSTEGNPILFIKVSECLAPLRQVVISPFQVVNIQGLSGCPTTSLTKSNDKLFIRWQTTGLYVVYQPCTFIFFLRWDAFVVILCCHQLLRLCTNFFRYLWVKTWDRNCKAHTDHLGQFGRHCTYTRWCNPSAQPSYRCALVRLWEIRLSTISLWITRVF